MLALLLLLRWLLYVFPDWGDSQHDRLLYEQMGIRRKNYEP